MKIWLIFLVSALFAAESSPILIEDQKDYDVLDQFFRMGVFEEEYGYVLEGAKPLSIRNFVPIEEIEPYRDPDFARQLFKNTLLAGSAIQVWKKTCSKQKNFALKAVPLSSSSTGWEIRFVNIPKLTETIKENIVLFRYILGPSIQSEALASQIADSDESLNSILYNDLTLIGIVLGFGIHNSLVGGRSETISSLTTSKDCAPFMTKNQLMVNKKEHSRNVYCCGGYYLEYAGGDSSLFQEEFQLVLPSQGYATTEDEMIALDAMIESLPSQLSEKPRFAFCAFKGGPSNKPFFEQLVQAQKRIQTLFKRPDFLERVLEKIGGKKPIIACKKPKEGKEKIRNSFTVYEWARILQNAAKRFAEEEQRLVFFESYCKPNEKNKQPPKMIGASHAMLAGIKIAQSNLSSTDNYFDILSKDESLKSLITHKLYFKTVQQGEGKELFGAGRIRIGYMIKDLKENILFASCDAWIDLAQTIPGFAHGLQNMRIGERRTLYIHPAFGYGVLTTLPPCCGLVVQVHLIDWDEKISGILPPLFPHDLDWFQEPSFIAEIESSLQEQPRYLGFLYRTMLDEIEGINQSEIVVSLTKL